MKINKKVLHFGLVMAEILILSICIYRTSKPEEFSQIFPYKSLESEEGLYLDSIGGEGAVMLIIVWIQEKIVLGHHKYYWRKALMK